jgi:hypothetical protein
MFAVYDSDTDTRDSVKFKTRSDWMDFLGAAYKVYFNPVLPKYSGFNVRLVELCMLIKIKINCRKRHRADKDHFLF